LNSVEVDTAHFKGNFPESCEIHALASEKLIPADDDNAWTAILSRTKLGPHKQHYFALENTAGKVYTHVKLTIHPDGGVKRLRIIGTRAVDASDSADELTAAGTVSAAAGETTLASAPANTDRAPLIVAGSIFPVLPLTAEAFAPYGKVLQAYADPHGAPRGVKVTGANQGTAVKFHKLSLVESSYPEGSGATRGLSVFRCGRIAAKAGSNFTIKLLERHPYTNQAFIPMSGAAPSGWGSENALKTYGNAYLVVVALNGSNDKPDLATLRAFIANGGQGIVYDTGVWREFSNIFSKCFTALTWA
jgi:allantoicase